MRTAELPIVTAAAAAWQLNPFLHIGPDRVYNPLADRMIQAPDPGYGTLTALLAGNVGLEEVAPEDLAVLSAAGWLLDATLDPARQFLLKYVSLEAHTVCNQSCYFCPVSIAPREDYFMPDELYERIVGELAAYRQTIEAVIMINYNEPTIDRRFVEQVRTIKRAGLEAAALSNGTGLTPDRVDALVEMGGLRFLSINLSTLDREKYRQDRGGDHLGLVLRNLDYMKDKPVAREMDMAVLGTGDLRHKSDFAEISARFAGSLFNVKYFEVNDRAGYLQIGLRVDGRHKRLAGCDHVGSRPLQHLHITPRAKAVLCCQDYSESVEVGDLAVSSVAEVLTGPEMARMRRMVYGLDEAPANFICRNCKFAITR